jgi:hypothetical protein
MARNLVVAALLLLMAVAVPATAQTIRTVGIEGTVRDDSGQVLPGVTVSLRSPALQVAEMIKVTGADGQYQFAGLPQGTYSATFALPGFTTLAREEIILTSGFTARVDVQLNVGGVEESVTVTGESPLVDVTTTRGGATLTAEALASIPNGYTFNDVLTLTPGLLPRTPSQAGHIGFPALSSNYNSYGFTGQERNFMDGVNFHSSEGVDFAIAEEVDTKTFGTTAETPTAGAQISIIVKSGGNEYHGRLRHELFHDALISSNVDDEQRRQGVGTGDKLILSNDFVGDLGGRFIRDTLWFYGAMRYQKNKRTQTGYAQATGPDGVYGTLDDVPGAPPGVNLETTGKLSYQPTARHRFTGMYNRGASIEWEALASRFRHRESTSQMHYTLNHGMGEWQGTLSDRLLVSAQAARSWYLAEWIDNLAGSPTRPSTLNRATQIETGQMFDTRSNLWRVPSRDQFNGTVSYFAGGHELKAGASVWHFKNVYRAPNLPAGNYQLVFDTVGGVPNRPVQLNAWNRPVSQHVQENLSAVFLNDTWRVTDRLTTNLGLRVDRIATFANATTKEQGPFGGAGAFPRVDAGTWNKLAPRAGLSFDITGDARTVAKVSYGLYNWDFGDTFATVYSQNTQATLSYRWSDPNGDSLYQPGEINLNTNGPDFISVSGATNPIVNEDLEAPQTHQIATSIERELTSNVSVRALYLFWEIADNFQTINPLRPPNAYSLPFSVRDPGPDGVVGGADDGSLVTIYDFRPEFRGAAFLGQSPTNRPPGRDDYANSFEATVVKRGTTLSGHTTMLFTKNHRWLTGVPQSPNDDFFPLDETWAWSYRAAGTYSAPYDLRFGVSYYLFNGVRGQRTNLFRGLPQSSTATIRMEPFGATSGPVRQNLDLKVARRFSFGSQRLEGAIDVLNLLNGNAAWTFNQQSGPAYNYATSIAAPRTTRLSVVFTF